MLFASLGESGPCIADIFTLITILLVGIFFKDHGLFFIYWVRRLSECAPDLYCANGDCSKKHGISL